MFTICYNALMKNGLKATICISVLILAAVLLVVGIARIFGISFYFEHFIALLAAFIGGAMTLFGVLLTIKSDEKQNKQIIIEKNKPQLFIPIRFDIIDAVNIVITPDSDNKNCNKAFNNKIYIKNSDKAPYVFEKLVINETEYKPKNGSYVEKGELLCLLFYAEKTFKEAFLHIKSSSNEKYVYKVSNLANRRQAMEEIS